MNALGIANELTAPIGTSGQSTYATCEQAAALLRRQHEAIVKLREAIRIVIDYSAPPTLAAVEDWVRLRQVLKDTEEFQ